MGTATAGGENRALQAVDEALHCPLLEENNIRGAKNILLNFTSGLKEVTMDEINIITNFIQREAGDDANLIWGTCFDDRLGENLTVTVIATGFEGRDNHRSLTDIFKLRNPISANDRNVVRLDEASERPSLYAITQDQAYTTVEEKPANAIEFEFDDIRRTVDGIRRKTSTDPYIGEDASDLAPEERRKRIEEMQKKQEEALNRPITVAKLTSPQTVIDLENQPAYQRKNVNLDDVQDAHQTTLSGWTINLEDEKVITQKDNAFLHKKQD
jgi:cell division protein FtsZ